ncbi:MAG: hypothetical protein AAF539_00420 [Planctomycetota bacterium]
MNEDHSGSSSTENATDVVDPARLARRTKLEQRVKTATTDRDAFLELAGIYREDGLPLHASRILKEAHQLFPDDLDVLWQWEEAQLERSLQQLMVTSKMAAETNSVALDQDVERCRIDWANCRLKICRDRLRRDASRDFLRLVLGEALYDLERFDEAIDELMPLADSPSHSPPAMLMMGRCHMVLSRDAEAMRCFRAASMQRAVVGTPKVRTAALKLLVDLADRHGLSETLQIYRNTLAALETSHSKELEIAS